MTGVPRVRILVCKWCVLNFPPEQRFRAADSPRGQQAIRDHALEEHPESYGTEQS